MKQLKLHVLNSFYKRVLKNRYISFMKSLSESRDYQRNYLNTLLRMNSETKYGRDHHFSGINTITEYKNNVPLITYDDITSYIDMMKNGRKNILFHGPPIMFEKTSGSTAATKYIPFNRPLLNEIHNATSAWIYNVYDQFTNLSKTTAYWSISPKLGAQEYTQSGIKVGFADDSEYFSPIERIFLKNIFAVDPKISNLENTAYREESTISLIRDENLGLISVWNPTLFILILDFIENYKEKLLHELKTRSTRITRVRLKHIESIFTGDKNIDFQALWPRLQFISCWTDGISSLFHRSLQKYFPDIYMQGKGLLMTEGVITIPIIDMAAPVLCINSHFYEFIEHHDEQANDNRPNQSTVLPHELEIGKEYIPVITTGGGLYRYITGDRVSVKGFHNDVPLLQFMGRCNNIVDLCGEKLNESFIEKIIVGLNKKYDINPEFSMLAPTLQSKPHYIYFVEARNFPLNLIDLADEFENLLCENHHYNLCRKLGQLAPVEIIRIQKGHTTYVKTMTDIKHQKYGNIKNKILDANLFWKEHFIAINNHSAQINCES